MEQGDRATPSAFSDSVSDRYMVACASHGPVALDQRQCYILLYAHQGWKVQAWKHCRSNVQSEVAAAGLSSTRAPR
jgi:hypothetical protein